MKKFFAQALAVAMLFSVLTPALAVEAPADTTPEAPAFSDISGHYAEDLILKYVEMGAISGYPDGTFRPDNLVTRAEEATIIARVLECAGKELQPLDIEAAARRGWYNTHSGVESLDIDPTAWYYPFVEKTESYLPAYSPSDYGVYMHILAPYYELSTAYDDKFLPNAYVPRFHLAETMVELKFYLEGLDDTIKYSNEATDHFQSIYKDGTLLEYISKAASLGINSNWCRMRSYIWLAYKYEIMTGFPDGYFYPYDGVTRAQILVTLDNILNDGGATE